MRAVEDRVFEFGDFVLAPKERLLMRHGKPIHLTAKAFDLLVALVSRSGHLVSKDDLLCTVWPNTIVEEVNLTVNVSALRKALDDGQNGREVIQTVPTRGYRFVAPVKMRDAAVAVESREISRDQKMLLPDRERPGIRNPSQSLKWLAKARSTKGVCRQMSSRVRLNNCL
jgi:DNA-binding winged helix-turn-helix (wHTH) protein